MTESKDSAATRHVANSQVWTYFGRNASKPTVNTIGCGCCVGAVVEHFATASDVFEAAGLNGEALRDIFRGGFCQAMDIPSWSKLAYLANRPIVFVHCHGSPEGVIRATYYPWEGVDLVNPNT